jgi:hypothetical protein
MVMAKVACVSAREGGVSMSSVATLRPNQNGTVQQSSGVWSAIGHWRPGASAPAFDRAGITQMVRRVREPICVVIDGNGNVGTAIGGEIAHGAKQAQYLCLGALPALYPE